MHPENAINALWTRIRFILVPVVVLASASALGLYFFTRGQAIMQEELRDHLKTTATVAALGIDPTLVSRVRDTDDMESVAFERLLAQVQRVRQSDDKILYAYIMRRTDDPDTLSFVIDADSALGDKELDENGNGTVEDDEAPGLPGEPYDVAGDGYVALRVDAFEGPAVDDEIVKDKWGSSISGYAPIRNPAGQVIAVLGIDMDAGQFVDLSQSIFSPIALLLVLLAAIVLAFYIQYMWHLRNVQSMKQLDGERTALLDLATHQLGMPLATFKWWLEILRDKDGGQFCEKNGICEEMQQGIDRMDQIIRSLHDANHLSKGTIDYKSERASLSEVIRESVDGMASDLRKSNQAVSFEDEGDVPPLHIDPKLIGGVISELIENAHMYSPSGARMNIRLSKKRNDAVIDVIDTGYGIAPDEVAAVFQKFRRGKDAMKRKPVGNGLGLYIAKGIVEHAGGSISLKSKLGQGTHIRITLPLP